MEKTRKRARIRQILSVFLRHGIGAGPKGWKDPVNIRLAFEELGPTFVKIGQMLSTRSDILPDPYRKEFQKLQDHVAPEPPEAIRAVLEKSLKLPPETVFSSFDREALAGASLAEVHRAVLKSGEEVAVKVQRPNAREMILNDLSILKLLCRFFKIGTIFHIVNMQDLIEELDRNIRLELDFANEAENIRRFRKNNREARCVSAPKVYEAYTSHTVLVMAYIDGIRIRQAARLKEEGYDLHDIGLKLANNYMKQILEDGFFHADPHPGNILIQGGQIVYIDFGLVGVLDKWMMRKIRRLLAGVVNSDVDMMAESVLQLGIQKAPVEIDRFRRDIETFYERYYSLSFEELNLSQLMNEMFSICRKNGIVIPKEVAMLAKGLMTMESVMTSLAPDTNMMTIAANYGMRLYLHGDRDVRHDMMEMARQAYENIALGMKVPAKAFHLLDRIHADGLPVRISCAHRARDFARLDDMVDRLILGLLICALIVGSALAARPSADGAVPPLAAAGYVLAAVLGAVLVFAMIRRHFPHR